MGEALEDFLWTQDECWDMDPPPPPSCYWCGKEDLRWTNLGTKDDPKWRLFEPGGERHSCMTNYDRRTRWWIKGEHRWNPWIKIIDADSLYLVSKVIAEGKKHGMEALVGLALSVAKWHPSRGARRGKGPCGLCNVFRTDFGKCNGCPLAVAPVTHCIDPFSYYSMWYDTRNSKPKVANLHAHGIYKALTKSYRKEYWKVFNAKRS